MVMSTKRKVGLPLCILCILFSPFLIYMARRMNKVRKALVIVAIDMIVSEIANHLLSFWFSTIVGLAFTIPFLFYFVNKWAKEWNKSLENSTM